MPVAKPFNKEKPDESMLSFGMRKRFGFGTGYGFIDLGRNEFGDEAAIKGTYQRRVTGYNQYGRSPGRKRKTYYVRMRDCTPNNPQTVPQQANRNKFKAGMTAWSALTPEEKQEWNKKAVKESRYGMHLFLKWWLNNN